MPLRHALEKNLHRKELQTGTRCLSVQEMSREENAIMQNVVLSCMPYSGCLFSGSRMEEKAQRSEVKFKRFAIPLRQDVHTLFHAQVQRLLHLRRVRRIQRCYRRHGRDQHPEAGSCQQNVHRVVLFDVFHQNKYLIARMPSTKRIPRANVRRSRYLFR